MCNLNNRRGVTLLELLIAIALLGLVLAGLYNTFRAQEYSYVVQEQVAEMNQTARIAMEIMSQEIRNAAYDPERNNPGSVVYGIGAGARISTATATSIIFTGDFLNAADCNDDTLPPDGAISCPGEWMGYRFNQTANKIEKCWGSANCVAGDWYESFDNIQILQFTYFYEDGQSSATEGLPNDADADDTNDLDDIREVEIQVVAQRRTEFGGGFENRSLTARVQVRNLALN